MKIWYLSVYRFLSSSSRCCALFLLILTTACSNRPEPSNEEQVNEFQASSELLNFSAECIAEDGPGLDGYYDDKEAFLKPYESVDYYPDSIVITCADLQNCCTEFTGDVKFKNDTLVLQTVYTGDIACTCECLFKKKYTVVNSGSKTDWILKFEDLSLN